MSIATPIIHHAPLPARHGLLTRTDYLPHLDGLRAIAAILVLVAHIPIQLMHPAVLHLMWILNPWYLGVDIFFVLSGFLITRILIADKSAGRPLSHFLMRRALRIFPIYYLLLFIMLFFRPASEIGWCAIYLANYQFSLHPVLTPLGHFWSLSVEEHFYLLWPWLVYGLSFRKSRAVVLYLLIPVAAAFAIGITLAHNHLPPTFITLISHGTQCRMASLGLGALFAYSEVWLRADKIRLSWIATTFLVGFIVINRIAHAFFKAEILPDIAHQAVTFFSFALLSGCLVLTAIGMKGSKSWLGKCLNNRPFLYIGRISYGLYLYHLPIYFALGLYGDDADPSLVRAAMAIVLSFGAAAFSYAYIETPLLRLKKHFKVAPDDAPLPSRARPIPGI
jgi:peptidoglycan/LPS O-acetylase OafA/YrhL